jgi:hypothetical protein
MEVCLIGEYKRARRMHSRKIAVAAGWSMLL